MKKLILSTALAVSCLATQVMASIGINPQAEAQTRLDLAKGYNAPMDPIPDGLRSIFNPADVDMKENHSTGAGCMTAFKIDDALYTVIGQRITRSGTSPKLSIGGKVEDEDKNIMDTLSRERVEECFGQLGFQRTIFAPFKAISGGFKKAKNGFMESEDWGPYFTFFAVEYGYNLAQLQAAVDVMNKNADLHVPVANFFHAFETFEKVDKETEAAALLAAFTNQEKYIVPLKQIVFDKLTALAADGNTELNEVSGFVFAKNNVHAYTEYKSFEFVPLNELPAPKDMFEDTHVIEMFKEFVTTS